MPGVTCYQFCLVLQHNSGYHCVNLTGRIANLTQLALYRTQHAGTGKIEWDNTYQINKLAKVCQVSAATLRRLGAVIKLGDNEGAEANCVNTINDVGNRRLIFIKKSNNDIRVEKNHFAGTKPRPK